MFSKGSNTKTTATSSKPESSPKAVPSIVSIELKVTGDLESVGEIQVDGQVEGDIKCSAVIIGVKGKVTGEISAKTVRVHGAVNGQVSAETVFLASTAQMIGDVSHESLAIEPGAYMEGHCRRMQPEPAKVESHAAQKMIGDKSQEATTTVVTQGASGQDASAEKGAKPADASGKDKK